MYHVPVQDCVVKNVKRIINVFRVWKTNSVIYNQCSAITKAKTPKLEREEESESETCLRFAK